MAREPLKSRHGPQHAGLAAAGRSEQGGDALTRRLEGDIEVEGSETPGKGDVDRAGIVA